MNLVGVRILTKASMHNKPLRTRIQAWSAAVDSAEWRNINDVRRTYPSADGVALDSGTVVTVFNVKGNNYRLLTWIDYADELVEVLEVISHAEYSKGLWKARY
jgi:mRNA interferase HigB